MTDSKTKKSSPTPLTLVVIQSVLFWLVMMHFFEGIIFPIMDEQHHLVTKEEFWDQLAFAPLAPHHIHFEGRERNRQFWLIYGTDISYSEFQEFVAQNNKDLNLSSESIHRTPLREAMYDYIISKFRWSRSTFSNIDEEPTKYYFVAKGVKDFLYSFNYLNQTFFTAAEVEDMIESKAILTYINSMVLRVGVEFAGFMNS